MSRSLARDPLLKLWRHGPLSHGNADAAPPPMMWL